MKSRKRVFVCMAQSHNAVYLGTLVGLTVGRCTAKRQQSQNPIHRELEQKHPISEAAALRQHA